MYGDMDRQAASILSQNSENTVNSAPRIAVYISDLDIDRDRIGDSTYIGKLQIRERRIENGVYTGDEGDVYTVERLMPTPYMLSLKVDIWSSSTDQKLQILEQILMFFNPSLEIQTTDNFIDWTSLSVVDLTDVTFSSRSIPVGGQTAIDVATIAIKAPIWISPPVKVKKMGIITKVIASIFTGIDEGDAGYIDGLGIPLGDTSPGPSQYADKVVETIGNYNILVSGNNVLAYSTSQEFSYVSWHHIIEQYPGAYTPGLLKIFLSQPDHSEVVGYGTVNILDETILTITDWDPDTYPTNTLLPGPARNPNSYGSFDAVLDPQVSGPKNVVPGTRYLLISDIGGGLIFNKQTFDYDIIEIHTQEPFHKVRSHILFVDGIQVLSSSPSSKTYSNLSAININGQGHNAKFNITAHFDNESYSGTIINAGIDYAIGDKIKIRGNGLGGDDLTNDCIIIVNSIDIDGGIITFSVYGPSKTRNYSIIPDEPILPNSNYQYELYLNQDGADVWKNLDGSDFIAAMNDIIEWDGTKWAIIMHSDTPISSPLYQTNLYTLAQYKWDGVEWTKSFEGNYDRADWRMVL
jgi:hypothetical protein